MKIRPVQSYPTPAYPDRSSTQSDPALLSRHVPAAWLRNEFVAGALAAFALGGCIESDCSEYDGKVSRKVAEIRDWLRDRTSSASEPTARVAPVFVHGEGRGATGCVVLSPPVFLPESEAEEIIESESKKGGIIVRDRHDKVKGVCADKRTDVSMWRKNDPGPTMVHLGPKTPVELDAVDPDRRVAYVYVSAIDSRIWDYLESSVRNFFTKDLAEHVRVVLTSRCRLNVGVFYDPLTSWRPAGHPRLEDHRRWEPEKRSAEDLRAQVRDFVAWAGREGVLK